MHIPNLLFIGLLFVLSTVYVGCTSFEPIQTNPPEAAVQSTNDTTEANLNRTVDLHFTTGSSELPERVSELRFRIPTLTLVTADSTSDIRELPHSAITISRDGDNSRTLLRTSINPATYDRVEVSFEDIFVTYGPNAGGPLTVENEPVTIDLPEVGPSNGPLILQLNFDVSESLRRGYDGRWSFSPQISAEVIDIEEMERRTQTEG